MPLAKLLSVLLQVEVSFPAKMPQATKAILYRSPLSIGTFVLALAST